MQQTANHNKTLKIKILFELEIDGVYYFPTFWFESIVCLTAFIILCIVRRSKYTKVGSMTASYLMIYGVLRFFIEIERIDAQLRLI